MGNKTYVLTSLSSVFLFVHLYAMTTVIGELPAAYGIADTVFLNKMGMYMELFGIIGGILFSIVLTWYPKGLMFGEYVITIGMIISLAFFLLCNYLADRTLLCVGSSAIGFFLFPMIFVSFELAVSQTVEDGVGDTFSCGLINMLANLLGFTLTLSLTPLLNKETKGATGTVFIILFVNLALGLVFLVLGSISSK